MQSAGFSIVACGEDGPAAGDLAEKWNARWDAHRASESAGMSSPAPRVYPFGSLGEAFHRFKATKTWEQKKPRTREDWERGWKYIEPSFGDVLPENRHARARRHLVRDPAGEDRRARGAPRDENLARAVEDRRRDEVLRPRRRPFARDPAQDAGAAQRDLFEGEAARLVKRAWRMGYRGLAAALAVAWDTMLSPVDVRALTRAQLRGDAQGSLFAVARAKTGKAAIGTSSRRTKRLLDTYSATLPSNLLLSAPIFCTRGGEPGSKGGRPWPPVPYTADTLGDDFRAVRGKEFPGDKRQLMDFRRSGAVEATALAGKMANTIDQSKQLQATYLQHNATLVRLADRARTRGRSRLRAANEGGSKS